MDVAKAFSEFLAFIEAAKVISSSPSPPAVASNRGDALLKFQTFLVQARPVAAAVVRRTLKVHKKYLERISRWIVPQTSDVLSASGLRGHEDPYTKLIAWILAPKGQPELGLRCQRSWLNAIGLNTLADRLTVSGQATTQLVTDNGRPDLVLHFRKPNFVLIVEAKVSSQEHVIPNKEWQTKGYPLAVRRKLGVPADYPGAMVLLTPDGREAASPDAIVTTYETFVVAIAESLSPDELPPALAGAYSLAITNMLTHAAAGGINKAEALEVFMKLPKTIHRSDKVILEHLNSLGALCQSLNSRKT